MKKIVTILCAFIFSINLSANAAMISVNEDSVLFSESNEEMGENDKKIYEELYENNEVENKELTSDSEVEKMDNDILLYDESINIETENKNFMIQEQKDELKEEVAIFDISTDGKITLQPNKTYEFINSSDEMVSVFKRSEQEVRYHILM